MEMSLELLPGSGMLNISKKSHFLEPTRHVQIITCTNAIHLLRRSSKMVRENSNTLSSNDNCKNKNT